VTVVNVKDTKADVYIGRGSRFGNPFPMSQGRTREQVIGSFNEWISHQPELLRLIRQVLPGKSLGCHCAPLPCHGHTVEEIASGQWGDRIPPEPVFVFGANLAGRHGRGSARSAMQHHGAQPGVGRGPTGNAYAIPTKSETLNILPLEAILEGLEAFKAHARQASHIHFQLTRIGCGLANTEDDREPDIREACLDAPPNVLLPGTWEALRQPDIVRLIVAGTRTFKDYQHLERTLDKLLANLMKQGKTIEIVSGGARGADLLGELYAINRGLALRRIPAEWERFGKAAGHIRNQKMSWYGTHLAAFWDGESGGTKNMISTARQDGLATRVLSLL